MLVKTKFSVSTKKVKQYSQEVLVKVSNLQSRYAGWPFYAELKELIVDKKCEDLELSCRFTELCKSLHQYVLECRRNSLSGEENDDGITASSSESTVIDYIYYIILY